jgi:hypothetical protein
MEFDGDCPEHGPLLIVKDTAVSSFVRETLLIFVVHFTLHTTFTVKPVDKDMVRNKDPCFPPCNFNLMMTPLKYGYFRLVTSLTVCCCCCCWFFLTQKN